MTQFSIITKHKKAGKNFRPYKFLSMESQLVPRFSIKVFIEQFLGSARQVIVQCSNAT